MPTRPPLPPIEVVLEQEAEVPPGRRRSWAVASWRASPVRSVVAALVLLVSMAVAFTVFRDQGGGTPHENLLQDWASAHHVGDPPDSITLPKLTCGKRDGDLEALKGCFRDSLIQGNAASGHVTADLSYPDALDYWATVRPDGTGRYVQRLVTVESRPDVNAGVVRPRDLREVVTEWVEVECDSVRVLPPLEDVLPGFDCENDTDAATKASTSRATTPEERADLIRRFACTYESIRKNHRC